MYILVVRSIALIKRIKHKPLSPFWVLNILLFEHIWIVLTQGQFVPSMVKLGPVVLNKKQLLNVDNIFAAFYYNQLPLISFKKWIPLTKS